MSDVRIEIEALANFAEWKLRFATRVLAEAKLLALEDPASGAVVTVSHWDAAMKAVLKFAADRYPS